MLQQLAAEKAGGGLRLQKGNWRPGDEAQTHTPQLSPTCTLV